VTLRRLLPLVIALTALAVAGVVPAQAAAKRTVPRGFFGVAFDGFGAEAPAADQDRHMTLMAQSGVESARLVFPWATLQPYKGMTPDFARTDTTIAAAATHGVAILPTILYTPVWARAYPKVNYSPPRHTSDFTAFLRACIRRYGVKGSFWRENPQIPRHPIRKWQIWNEPNNDIERYWQAPRKSAYGWPQGYVRLLRAADRTIKHEDRRAKTVLAGITGIAWLEMRRAYKKGAKNHFDIAALQVYPQTEKRELEAVRRMRQELVRAHDGDVRMSVTEVAFPASKGKVKPIFEQRQETPVGMGRRLSSLYKLLARKRKALKLDSVYWYTWASRYGKNKSNFDFSGLVKSADGLEITPQPALAYFRRTAQRLEGCAKKPNGACR
jgi:hypothetical protein